MDSESKRSPALTLGEGIEAMAQRHVKCFVAMAFGRNDCDQLYDEQIRPTLNSLGLSLIRVDRRQHRDDLNNYIIRMLKQSDISLVDLTYARPSVYYEGGYAERVIPVVYTAREDHLSRSQPDDRLRVHFDLEMKKIVSWHDPHDPTFAGRLRQRIRYLLSPIIRSREAEERLEKDRREFSRRSVASRCEEIQNRYKVKLKGKRFWVRPLWDVNQFVEYKLRPAQALFGIKLVNKTCHSVVILAAESITKRQIEYAITGISGRLLLSYDQQVSDFEDHFFLCALRKIPPTRLTGAFPDASPHMEGLQYSLLHQDGFRSERGERRIRVHLVSPVDSMRHLKQFVQDTIQSIPDQKSNRFTYLLYDKYKFHKREVQFERKHSPSRNMRLVSQRRPPL